MMIHEPCFPGIYMHQSIFKVTQLLPLSIQKQIKSSLIRRVFNELRVMSEVYNNQLHNRHADYYEPQSWVEIG